MKINFVGAVFDSIGYGEFARNCVSAMSKAGADLAVEMVSFEREHADHGPQGDLCKKLMAKQHKKPDVNIVNMVPKLFPNARKQGSFNIGFTMFETTRIPDVWVRQCNELMDAILVPCEWNKKVFEDSGVKVPVAVAHAPLNEIYYGEDLQPTVKRVLNQFCFYSIFQWTARKHPLKLIEAYWKEFSGQDDVCLVLKTFRKDFSPLETNKIKQEMLKLKVKLKLKHYPKIAPIFRKLSNQEIINIHLNNDCLVLPHAAEGLGLPHMEAMALGNPVIATGFSGNVDFMNDENSYLIKNFDMVPVGDMDWIGPWYDKNTMQWADPDIEELREKMRYVYESQSEAKKIGKIAQHHIRSQFSQEACGKEMLEVISGLHSDWKK